jgi:glycosyltransferase involved in cell wall biosynthesis
MADQLRGLCRVPVQVVANPIAEQPTRDATRGWAARLRVLMVCNGWGPRKNGDAGLRAFHLLHERLPAVELHLYGRGTEEGGPAWQAWRTLRGKGDVVFHGVVSHDAVLDAMAGGSLMLHPALEESFGAVLAEAMSVGLPVIAGRDSGAVAWVVGDAGVLVDVTRPDAMADAMVALLLDPATARRRAERGRARVRACFSPPAVAAQYEREYERVLALSAAKVAA